MQLKIKQTKNGPSGSSYLRKSRMAEKLKRTVARKVKKLTFEKWLKIRNET